MGFITLGGAGASQPQVDLGELSEEQLQSLLLGAVSSGVSGSFVLIGGQVITFTNGLITSVTHL